MTKKLIVILTILTVGLLTACGVPTKVTGGGWMGSNSGNGTANFGFNAKACVDPFKATGHFNFHDKNGLVGGNPVIGGVDMNGQVVEASKCIANGASVSSTVGCQVCGNLLGIDGEMGHNAVVATYNSINPKALGSGIVYACAKDNGEGSIANSDLAIILVSGGPFDSYRNTGAVTGNIQDHPCE